MNIMVSADLFRKFLPRRFRHQIQRFVSLTEYKVKYNRSRNPYSGITHDLTNTAGCPYTFGVIENYMQYHQYYIAACMEMGIPFKVFDIGTENWISVLEQSGCGIFLIWPDAHLTVWNTMMNERLKLLSEEMGKTIYPSLNEIWLYEHKRRMLSWLRIQEFPHPRTWIFYDLDSCLAFAEDCELPIVYKSDFGAAAAGVRIFSNRRKLKRFVGRVFRKGFVPAGHDYRDRQWGNIILQEYLPDIREWRMVRIGNSYFGHVKGRVGGFHSGSGAVEWDVPEKRHLDLLHAVTERGRFTSINVDVFETADGSLLINELQTVFGASHSVDQMIVEGQTGRFVHTPDGDWRFEAGDFARNACANERIRYIIDSDYPKRSHSGQ